MELLNDFFKLFDKVDKQNIEEGEFYTLVKGTYKVYLSHYTRYADMDDVGKSNAFVAVYRDHENILSFEGTFDNVLAKIKKIL